MQTQKASTSTAFFALLAVHHS